MFCLRQQSTTLMQGASNERAYREVMLLGLTLNPMRKKCGRFGKIQTNTYTCGGVPSVTSLARFCF